MNESTADDVPLFEWRSETSRCHWWSQMVPLEVLTLDGRRVLVRSIIKWLAPLSRRVVRWRRLEIDASGKVIRFQKHPLPNPAWREP